VDFLKKLSLVLVKKIFKIRTMKHLSRALRLCISTFCTALCASVLIGQISAFPEPGVNGTGIRYLPFTGRSSESIWWNQAGLAQLGKPTVGIFSALPFGVPELRHAGIAVTLPLGIGGGGFSLQRLGNGNYYGQQIGFAYGRPLHESLAIGARWNISALSMPGRENPLQMDADFGFISKIGARVQFGFHAAGIWSLRKARPVAVHVTMGFKSSEKVFLALEIEKDVDFPPDLRAGVEYRPSESLFLRFGSSLNPAKALFGVGYLLSEGISVDFAVEMHTTLGLIPCFGLTYQKRK